MRRSGFKPRTKPMPRGKAGLRSSTPIKARNAKRWTKNQRRAFGSKDRAEFVRWLPCIVCGAIPSENAHTPHPSAGMGYRGDAVAVAPICWAHHQGATDSLHKMGPGPFERLHGVNLEQAARDTEAAWQRHVGDAA